MGREKRDQEGQTRAESTRSCPANARTSVRG